MDSSAALALLRASNSDLICVDIGSAEGFHVRFDPVRERAMLIGVEADPAECKRLNARADARQRHINAAAGREGETLTLHLHRKRMTSSAYATDENRARRFQDPERLTPEQDVTFTTRGLGSILAEESIDRIDYLKVDVEGHELAVLQGYDGPLLMADIEANFHPFRKGVPLFDELMAHMRSRGFLLMDLRRTYWSATRATELRNFSAKGFLMVGDALFLLDPFLPQNDQWLATEQLRARYLALLCLYGYTAEALMVIDVFRERELMSPAEVEASRRTILQHGRRRKFGLPRVGRLLLAIERYFKLPVSISTGLFLNGLVQADGDLGNPDMLSEMKAMRRRA